MQKQEVDITDKILEACYKHNPDALFVLSLMHQYEERGSLSKKQLQGLLQKALKVQDMPQNWLATLEAKIAKMPNRFKSEMVAAAPLYVKDDRTGKLIDNILAKYPQHKRVLFFKTKFENNETLTASDIAELEKFTKILLKI